MKSEGYSFVDGDVEFGEDDYEKIVPANNSLGFALLDKVEPNAQGNVFISPTSLMMALSMIYHGADGTTKEEIAQALQLEGIEENLLNQANASLGTGLYKDTDQLMTTIANSIWIHEDYQFQDSFIQTNLDYYNALVEEMDLTKQETADRINHWVKKATNDKIKQMVDGPLGSDVVALLLNAIYFKGEWKYAFEPKDEKGEFSLADGTGTEVDQMSLQEELLYQENDTFQAVRLPYGNEDMHMDLFLPRENISVDAMKEILTNNLWEDRFVKKEGTVILPMFAIEYEVLLNKPLMEMGMVKAFTDQAQFPHMIEEEVPVYVSEVKQKTFIEVNEKGTEAAAATSVEMKTVSAPVDGPFYLEVNRPFLFTITDQETGAILFIGTVANPT